MYERETCDDEEKAQYALSIIDDVIADYLYYDRKECEMLRVGEIERLVKEGKITIDQIVEKFQNAIRKRLDQ